MRITALLLASLLFGLCIVPTGQAFAQAPVWRAHSTLTLGSNLQVQPTGYTPQQIRSAYGFSQVSSTGQGKLIAIVDAYMAPTTPKDLETFSRKFNLPLPYGLPSTGSCTVAAGPHPCLQIIQPAVHTSTESGWQLETNLDVEWAHAIASTADIAVVLAHDSTLPELIKAVDGANALHPTVVSMSWGGTEFADEGSLQSHFNKSGVSYVASAGDSGAGVSFPGVLPTVLSVGGTHLTLNSGNPIESAWAKSGGGISAYLVQPTYQRNALSGQAHRAVPDVSYNADPATGYAIYSSTAKSSGWYEVGGTSAGAPQWAALLTLGATKPTATQLYATPASFQDILSGSNGRCKVFCLARPGYDTVTGLGSPHVAKLVSR